MLDFPNGPLLGQTFYAAGVAWEWDGEKWTAVGTEPSGVTGSNEITISDTAPAAPVSGQLWWDSVSGNLFLWYVDLTSSQWVPAMSESGGLSGGYLLTSGGQMTGPLSLYGNATANLQAVPLQQLTTSLGGYIPTTGGTVNGPLTVQGSLVYTATGAITARAAQDRATDIVNVKDYGTTGTADDAATFAAALNAVAAGGRLLVPAGSYNIGSALVVAVTGGVTFEGAGSGVTILNFINSTDGVTFNLSASAVVHVKGMTIARAVSVITGPTTYANTGLTIATAAVVPGARVGKPTIEDVHLRGNAARGSGWLTSLYLSNVSSIGVDHITITNPDATGTQTGTGIFWQGLNSSSFSVDSSFNDISIQGGGVGFSVGNYVQGVYLVNSRIIGVDYGIYWPSTPGVANLWINVANCHFNAGTRGFYVTNIGSVTIANTLFIRFPVNSVTGNWAGIEIDVTYAALIANNIIRGNTSGSIPTAQNGIMLANGNTTTVTGNMITSLDNPIILNGMINTAVTGNIASGITGSQFITDTTGDPSNQHIGNQFNGVPNTATAFTAASVTSSGNSFTQTGLFVGTATSQGTILLTGPNATIREMEIYTGAATSADLRWTIGVSAASETGSNAGTDFRIRNIGDTGTQIGTPLSITRATGVVNFSAAPTVAGAPLPYLSTAGGVLTGPLTGTTANFTTSVTTPSITAWIPEHSLFNGISAQHVANLNAAIHRATSGAPALVGIIGDSTSVATSSSAGSEGMTEHLRQALAEQFGATAFISIFDFGIGGQTWTTLDSIPTGFDWWYTNTSNSWLSYPQNYTVGSSVGCDCLIIAMGTNDRNNLVISHVASVINKIKAWSKPCDIILVTNPRGSSVYTGTAGTALQNTFDYSASYVRSYAIRNQLGLIDANRWLTIVRDGYDLLETTMQVGLNGVLQNFPYTFPAPLLDYSFRFYVGAIGGIFNGNTFSAQIGADPGNVLQITQDSSGNFAFQIFANASTQTVGYTVTNILCPTSGSATFEVCVKGSHVIFNMINPTYPNFGIHIVDAWFDKIGGTFTPTLGFAVGGNGVMYTAIGIPAVYQTQSSDLDIYGDVNGNNFPFGGSAGLHMSSIGQQRIYNALFRGVQWSAGSSFLPLSGGQINGSVTVTGAMTVENGFSSWQGPVIGYSGAGGVEVTANAGVGNRGMRAQTNGVDRWRWGANNTAEPGAGSNNGSDFQIFGFQDSGAPFGAMLIIARSSGLVSMPYGLATGAGNATVNSGTGAPSATRPIGSLYMRTDGTAGARLYVSAGGGTWTAVAGV